MPDTNVSVPVFGEVGQLLQSFGDLLQSSPNAVLREWGAATSALGEVMAASDMAGDAVLDGTENGKSAAEIAGGIAGALAVEIGIAAALANPATLAALGAALALAGVPPLVGAIALAAGTIILASAGAQIGENIAGALEDLLAAILRDPIVLDLDGDGIELTALAQSSTMFDLDADGALERTGWVSPQDGLLVQDGNGNGLVDGVDELFGSANVDGFDELRTLDSNADGRIDASDPAFAQLRVWRDLNSDGVSTADEMLTLDQAGITSFNLNYSQVDQNVADNIVARTGTYVRPDGTSRAMGSINFALDESTTTIPENADLGDLVVLPNLSGVDGLPDLRTAMFFDATLKTMVNDLVYGTHDFDTFVEFRDGGFLDLLYRWAGIDKSQPLGPDDQPYWLQLLSAFMGRPFDELTDAQIERVQAEVWPALVQQLGVQFLVQAADLPAIRPFYEMGNDLAASSANSSLIALSSAASCSSDALTWPGSPSPAIRAAARPWRGPAPTTRGSRPASPTTTSLRSASREPASRPRN